MTGYKFLFNKIIVGTLLLIVSGCSKAAVEGFTPYTPEIRDKELFIKDLGVCRGHALNYLLINNNLDVSEIASSGATKAVSNAGTGIVNPLIPGLYGLGGASGELLRQLGLDSQDAKKIITICMHDKGLQSKEYSVFDPNN